MIHVTEINNRKYIYVEFALAWHSWYTSEKCWHRLSWLSLSVRQCLNADMSSVQRGGAYADEYPAEEAGAGAG